MYHNENKTHKINQTKKTVEKVKKLFSQNSIKTRNCHEVNPGLHLYLSEKSVKTEKSYDFVTFCEIFTQIGLILYENFKHDFRKVNL